ncbi:hypothetical protein J1614_006754 [Plenodomus biglobosus]|nr:hypothetical protein J1614_006754 [Plenodomus biglobosus]
MFGEVAQHLGSSVVNLRSVDKWFCYAVHMAFVKAVVDGRVLYPRYGSFSEILSLLGDNFTMGMHVSKIIIVSEGLKIHEYGYEWAWERLQFKEDALAWNEADMNIIKDINHIHYQDIKAKSCFTDGGGYRATLTKLLTLMPRLAEIEVRKLHTGEHVPDWEGPELLKGLSFYKAGLDTNSIFYGEWEYDTKHLCRTSYIDEFGDKQFSRDDYGEQASCIDDVKAAMKNSGTRANLVEQPKKKKFVPPAWLQSQLQSQSQSQSQLQQLP